MFKLCSQIVETSTSTRHFVLTSIWYETLQLHLKICVVVLCTNLEVHTFHEFPRHPDLFLGNFNCPQKTKLYQAWSGFLRFKTWEFPQQLPMKKNPCQSPTSPRKIRHLAHMILQFHDCFVVVVLVHTDARTSQKNVRFPKSTWNKVSAMNFLFCSRVRKFPTQNKSKTLGLLSVRKEQSAPGNSHRSLSFERQQDYKQV